MQEFSGQLVAHKDQYAVALPPHISAERFQSAAITAVNLNPDLLKPALRRSLFNACTKAAQDGLMPDGREGALVIFGSAVAWLPMVYGIIKKARQSGEIATLGARIVYQNELDAGRFKFTITNGEDTLEHDPILFGERGAPVGAYARVKFKDGAIEYEILNKAELDKIRNVSRAKNSGPWVDWWEEMAKKTAIRRLAKRLPLSADLVATVTREDEVTEYDQIRAVERERLIGAATAQLGAPKEVEGEIIDAETTEEAEDETIPEPLQRAARLLKQCKTKPEIDDLLKSITDELGDDYERGLLKQLGQTRMNEL